MSAILPIPRTPIAIRVATAEDFAAIDALQKQHSKALGYFPTKQLMEYIGRGNVLVAEGATERRSDEAKEGEGSRRQYKIQILKSKNP
jgi:hypothetical protein